MNSKHKGIETKRAWLRSADTQIVNKLQIFNNIKHKNYKLRNPQHLKQHCSSVTGYILVRVDVNTLKRGDRSRKN